MNTEKIYTAQLNVSKFYTDETINDLVSRISSANIGDETYYNDKTKTIDIKCNRMAMVEDDFTIREIIKEWIQSLPINKEDIDIIINNMEFIFNITKLGYPNIEKHIINIYLY